MATVKLELVVDLPGTDPGDLEDAKVRLDDAVEELRLALGADEDARRLVDAAEVAVDALTVDAVTGSAPATTRGPVTHIRASVRRLTPADVGGAIDNLRDLMAGQARIGELLKSDIVRIEALLRALDNGSITLASGEG